MRTEECDREGGGTLLGNSYRLVPESILIEAAKCAFILQIILKFDYNN
jgi:hypothetical protein